MVSMVLAAVVVHLTFSLDRLQAGHRPVAAAAASVPARFGITLSMAWPVTVQADPAR